jgi:septal ring factor EnvC (AmiA/AmiB activator)
MLTIILLFFPGAAPAQVAQTDAQRKELQDVTSRMSEAEQHRHDLEKQATEISAEVTDLRSRMIAAARSVQNQEVKVTGLEDRVKMLNSEKTEHENALAHRRLELASTLAAMQRLSQQPAELVLVKPDTALNMARSATLLGAVMPGLRQKADEIRKSIEELDTLRQQLETERRDLGQELNRLNSERRQMDQLLAERKQEQKEILAASAEERKRVLKYAAKAKDLSALIEQLEREASSRRRAAEEAAARLAKRPGGARDEVAALTPPPGPALDETPGKLPLPVRGRLVRGYGAPDPSGLETRGITIEARPNAQVVSPASGRIVFAGPFRGYGQLVIIASGEGYHTLLAGLVRIDGVVGQKILAGEPVGQMGAGSDATDKSGLMLYVELRKQGKPINPLPWLAAGLGKVSG